MKRLLFLSIFLTLALMAALWLGIQRLGGLSYARYRLTHPDTGVYQNRKQLFDRLQIPPNAIVMLGDSHMQGCEWAELLQMDSQKVINRGINGDHIRGVSERIAPILQSKPARIYLQVGINDLLLGSTPEMLLPSYLDLLQKIRKESPSTILILMELPPVNSQVKHIPLTNERIREMNTKIRAIAKEYAIPVLDTHAILTDANGNLMARLTDDGIHINGDGYLLWKKLIVPREG